MLRNVAKNFLGGGWWLFGLTCDIILNNGDICKIFVFEDTQLSNLSVKILSLVPRTCQPSALR